MLLHDCELPATWAVKGGFKSCGFVFIALSWGGLRRTVEEEEDRFNYVCTSTTTESADSRAHTYSHTHDSSMAKWRTSPQSVHPGHQSRVLLQDWSESWIFNKSAVQCAPCLIVHHIGLCWVRTLPVSLRSDKHQFYWDQKTERGWDK